MDNILEFLVQASNEHDFSLDITLNVKGAVITGTMISAKEYFDTLSESFKEGSETAQKISKMLIQSGDEFKNKGSAEVNFIHLKDMKVYCGDSKPTPSRGKVVVWRGKLSEIDGFFLGKITDSRQ